MRQNRSLNKKSNLKRFRDNPFKLFIASFILKILEILRLLSTIYYRRRTTSIWNNKCGFIYILVPILDDLYKRLEPKIRGTIYIILLIILAINFTYSCLKPYYSR